MEALEGLSLPASGRGRALLALGSALLVAFLLAGCESGPSPKEVALRATVEALRDELSQTSGAAPAPKQPSAKTATPPTPVVPKSTPGPGAASLLLNWQDVGERSQVGDLELVANALLLGRESYGGPYGSRISSGPGTKIVLADLSLRYEFRPGVPPTETHVDFFVIGDSSGLEYRGLPVPVANALPDRFFLSPGQAFRGVVAFILPKEMKTGRLYFTNFLGGKDPPERLTVYLKDIP